MIFSPRGLTITSHVPRKDMRKEDLPEVLTNQRHFDQKAFALCFVIPETAARTELRGSIARERCFGLRAQAGDVRRK